MKKLKAILIAILLFALYTSPVAANDIIYSDVTGHWAETDIYYITNENLLNGYPNGSFQPDKTISRAEFVNILVKDAGVDIAAYDKASKFSDVGNHWTKAAINWATQSQVVTGYDNNTFRPDAAISREELATMLNRHIRLVKGLTLEYKYPEDPFNDNRKISPWAKEAVTAMQRYGLIQGKGNYNFCPQETATRAETATMTARYIRTAKGESASYSQANIYLNNNLVKQGVAVVTDGNTTMIAMRDFFEAIGYEVAFYNNTSLVAAYNQQNDLEFWLGKTKAYANGQEKTLSAAPYTVNSSTMAPLKDIGTALGISIIQDNQGQNTANIKITLTPASTNRNGLSFYGSANSAGVQGEISLGNKTGFWGTVKNGNMVYGSYTTNDGYRYFGNWSNAQFSGPGRAINPLGELSVGTFANGYMSQGVTYFADGSSFQGQWYYNANTTAIYPGKGVLTAQGRSYGTESTDWSGGALTASKW